MKRGRRLGENLYLAAAVFALAGLGLTISGRLTSLGVALLAVAAVTLVAGGVTQVTAWIRPSGAGQGEGIPSQTRPAAGRGKASSLRVFMRRHTLWLALGGVVLISLLSVGLGSFLPLPTGAPQTREFTVSAKQFSYSPERISVNKGDRVILRLQPKDVSHGLYVDGYGVETHAAPKKEGVVEFVADNPGTYRFRCSTTCGVMHPFMVGEVAVEPNTPFRGAAAAILVVALGVVGYGWWSKDHDAAS
ncbi:MAG: cupredoxin domain-containing protein [Chloroflexota bacterium]|nr:cupredoxin domain-containing protein [Chloroflexota bacterium]